MSRNHTLQRGSLKEIPEAECLRLVEGRVVGRIAIVHDGVPRVFPVNYTLDRGYIVFRFDPGMKLDAAEHGQVATFEVDDTDPLYHTGWSVMVTGVLHVVSDPDELRLARSLPVRAWGTAGATWVRLRPIGISGRRISR